MESYVRCLESYDPELQKLFVVKDRLAQEQALQAEDPENIRLRKAANEAEFAAKIEQRRLGKIFAEDSSFRETRERLQQEQVKQMQRKIAKYPKMVLTDEQQSQAQSQGEGEGEGDEGDKQQSQAQSQGEGDEGDEGDEQ